MIQIDKSAAALIMLSGLATSAVAAEQRPNIIFILTDDQPYELLGCNGHPVVQTPNFDKMAAEGVRFTNAHVSTAISSPSRTCILTGQFERSHGVNFNSQTALSAEAWNDCYPMVLRANGYYTGYIGKNHTPIGEKGYATGLMDSSFDYWYGGHQHLSFYPKKIHSIYKGAQADTQVEILEEGTMDFLNPNERNLKGAVSFLKGRPEDKPFFLNVCFNLPHGAGTSTMKMLDTDPEIYRTMYRDKEIPLPANYIAKADIKEPKLPAEILHVGDRQTIYDYVDTPEKLREMNIREMEAVTGIDLMLGALRAELKRQGLDKNTIIIFTADHGIFNGQYGLGGKALCYEYCTRVPMIIYDPRTPRSAVNDELVLALDIAPTILDYAGIKSPASYQGESLVKMTEGKEEKVRDYLFTENIWVTPFGNPPCESVQTKEWKYIRYYENDSPSALQMIDISERLGLGNVIYKINNSFMRYRHLVEQRFNGAEPQYEELYNLASDPWEATNLINDRRYSEVLDKMRKECDVQLKYARGEGIPRVEVIIP